MSGAHTWFCRGLLALLAGAAGLTIPSAVRADVVDDFKANQKVAAQKLEQDVKNALFEAQKLKVKSPEDALDLLNYCKASLQKDTLLPKGQRQELLDQVNTQIKGVQALMETPSKIGTTPKTKPKSDDEEDLYAKYNKGKYGSSSGGGGVSGTAGKLIGDNKKNLDDYKNAKGKIEKTVVAMGQPDIGVIPDWDKGVAFSPKHKEIKELRLALAKQNLTKEEAALIKAMSSYFTPDFTKVAFQDVIKILEEKFGVTIAVDPNAMKALEIDYSTPVTFKTTSKVTLRTTLKKVLGDVGLAYILKDGLVQVVTPQVAQNTMTTRAYYIGDLIPPPQPGTGPYFRAAQEQYYANQIMQMIVTTVEPQSWAANGNGKGTIYYNAASKSIVVSNSAEMHLNLKASMSGGGY